MNRRSFFKWATATGCALFLPGSVRPTRTWAFQEGEHQILSAYISFKDYCDEWVRIQFTPFQEKITDYYDHKALELCKAGLSAHSLEVGDRLTFEGFGVFEGRSGVVQELCWRGATK